MLRTRALIPTLIIALSMATPGWAQIPLPFVPRPVIDNANLAQAILIAQRAQRHLEQLQAQYRTIMRMAQRLPGLDRYRIPTIPIVGHDPGRWTYGRRWIEALNGGDPRGTAFWSTAIPLQVPSTVPTGITANGRLAMERAYATIEIADSIASMGAHQVALARGYHGRLQDVVEELERDVLNPAQPYHEMTAVLEKIAAGELLGRRQDMAGNQLLSHALEQLLARSKRERDTEASTINMQLTTWREAAAANAAFVAGTGAALQTWRQP